MQKSDASTLFLLFFSIYIAITSYTLGLGTLRKPGPGFFPFGGALIVGMNAIVVLVKALSRRTDRDKETGPGERTRWWNVAGVLGATVVFALLLSTLGFMLCTFFLFIFFLRGISSQRWSKAIIVALGVAVGSYVLFEVLLQSQLPRGFLEF